MTTLNDDHHLEEPQDQERDDQLDREKRCLHRPRVGEICLRCQAAQLDYNGLLQLACPQCGVIETGAFT
jgi:hypothetical protein